MSDPHNFELRGARCCVVRVGRYPQAVAAQYYCKVAKGVGGYPSRCPAQFRAKGCVLFDSNTPYSRERLFSITIFTILPLFRIPIGNQLLRVASRLIWKLRYWVLIMSSK